VFTIPEMNSFSFSSEAYIAGLVAADGYIAKREIRIATNNPLFVRVIVEILGPMGYKPKVTWGTRVYLVRIYSVNLKEKLLSRYNLFEGRKAHLLIFPENLSEDEKKSFLAGYFDGDGSIGLIKSGLREKRWGPYVTPRIVFSSKSSRLLEGVRGFLSSKGLRGEISSDGNIYRLRYYGCKNLKIFLGLLGSFILNPERRAGARAGANSCREVSG